MDPAGTANSTVKTTPEAGPRIQAQQQPNGVLKRHAPPPSQNHHTPVVVTYHDCQKNHAASIGGHAVDGCGEFMPESTADPSDPRSLNCAACGCHRNFHRREPDDSAAAPDFTSLLRHQPPRRGDSGSSPNDSPSPPPISSAYFPQSAPAHMLLALSHGASAPISAAVNPPRSNSDSRKRFRTKFSQDQKDKMLELAERVDWKLQKKDEELIKESCSEIGVKRGVFKVWMHNNKNTIGKKDYQRSPPSAAAGEEAEHCSKEENNDSIANGSSSS